MPVTSYCNPKPGLVAILSPSTYPPGGTQHLLFKSISIPVNDLVFPLLWCEGKRRVGRCHKTLPAQRRLSHQLCSMVPGQGWGHTAHLFSPNTHVQMCLPSQPYAHKHACTHALTHARARTHTEKLLHACFEWKIMSFAVSDKSMFECIWKTPSAATWSAE